MTREEAVIILDGFKNNPLFNDTHAQAFNMAISALSEMSDLISRKSLLNKINAYVVGSQDKEFICKLIKEMPSVENKGEWERVSGGSFIDVYRCSKCKHEPPKKPLPNIKTWGWDFTDFCPNCGAKMKGSE